MTNSDRRRQLKALFAAAADLEPDARPAYLDRECPSDLRAEVEDLLAFDEGPDFLAPESDAALEVPAAAVAATPERLGRYRILREIGAGGMGRVFEAEQERPRRRVALKVVHALQAGGELAQRFEREAELLGRLEHPGIARIYEAGVDGEAGVPFFAMELIDGVPLLEYADGAGLDAAGRLELITRIAEPVAYAHHRGVIHRDLKPGNILVTRDGQPKILDFGIARTADGEDLQATRVGQVVGTVTHMSPEQAAGRPDDVDTRTDIYALGVIAFELLTGGEQPHDTTDIGLQAALQKIVTEPPRRVDRLAPQLRGDVATIVHKALEKDRDARYASADAFADDIRRFLRCEPIAARPASTWYQLRRFAARHRVVVTALGLGLLSLLVGLTVAIDQAIDARRAASAERQARARAERRLGDVREFATHAMFEIHDDIKHLTGATEARRKLMDLGHDALLRLRAEEADDPGLLRDVAQAFVVQGRLRGGGSYHLGDSVGAAECLTEGVRLWRLVVNDPGIEPLPRDRAKLGLALYHLAMNALDEREFETAENRLREAAAVMRPALERYPEDQDLPGDLGSVLTRLGRVLLPQGRAEEALALFEEGLALNELSLQRSRDDASRSYNMRALVISYNWLGNYFRDVGDLQRAAVEYARYRDCAERLHAIDPDDELDQANLAIAHKKLAQIAVRRDDLDGAAAELRRTLELLRPLLPIAPRSDQPVNLRRVFQVVDTVIEWAELQSMRGDPAAALRELDAATDWTAFLRERAGDNANWRWHCDVAMVRRAEALAATGRLDAAETSLAAAEQALGAGDDEDQPVFVLRAVTDLVACRWQIAWRRGDREAAQRAAADMLERVQRLRAADDSAIGAALELGAKLFAATASADGDNRSELAAATAFGARDDISATVRRLAAAHLAAVQRR